MKLVKIADTIYPQGAGDLLYEVRTFRTPTWTRAWIAGRPWVKGGTGEPAPPAVQCALWNMRERGLDVDPEMRAHAAGVRREADGRREIKALKKEREYWRGLVHNLETQADPSGTVREAFARRENQKALEATVKRLRKDLLDALDAKASTADGNVQLFRERDEALSEARVLRAEVVALTEALEKKTSDVVESLIDEMGCNTYSCGVCETDGRDLIIYVEDARSFAEKSAAREADEEVMERRWAGSS